MMAVITFRWCAVKDLESSQNVSNKL